MGAAALKCEFRLCCGVQTDYEVAEPKATRLCPGKFPAGEGRAVRVHNLGNMAETALKYKGTLMSDDGNCAETENVIPFRPELRDGSPLEVTTDRLLRIKMRLAELKMDQAALSVATGLSNSAISQILRQKIKKTRHFPAFAKALGVNIAWLVAETDQRINLADWQGGAVSEADLPQLLGDSDFAKSNVDEVQTAGLLALQTERRGDNITLPEIDLTLASSIKISGIPIKGQGLVFSREVIRTYTRADCAHVMVATGIGDAMQPTLLDGDLLFIDTAQQKPDGADKLWAFVYSGVGMVRRLRATVQGIRIMSDSPNLPGEMVDAGEITVLGLVAGCVRRL
jgi:transcriptional regulator with XRE-family HTH domain